ncbi:MurR/RpiR family transcriptional regulator [Amycolatopsis sp. A1MSW2902]|uniref:MurR/RpiR family transcriptional regulator n=1 Tax=unclassified Amycolatopsis TaxID=2618356 RepID=UPI0003AB3AB2|nr:MurR/RpiR family transcriptional regulator [Amycolatopsis sp. La24]
MSTTYLGGDHFDDHVRARLDDLKPAERQVARFMLANPNEVLFSSAGDLGAAAGTSDATVVRTAKALGYSGLPELKRHLGQTFTARTEPTVRLSAAMENLGSTGSRQIDRVMADSAERLQEMQRQLAPEAVEEAARLLLAARMVFTWGLGLSSVCAEYAAFRLARRGLVTRHCDDTGFRLADAMLPLSADDAVLVYVPARQNRDVELILRYAEEVGAPVVLVTSQLSADLESRVRVVLPAPDSPTKFTGETLTASIVTDILAHTIAGREPDRAKTAADLLTRLRADLGERK